MNQFSVKTYGLGIGIVIGILLLSTVVLTALLYFTDVSEEMMQRSGPVMQYVAVFLGSLIAACKAKRMGIVYGVSIASTAIAAFCIGRYGLENTQFMLMSTDIFIMAVGIFGGMVGIGLSEQ